MTLSPTPCNQHIRRENQMVDLRIHSYHNDMIEAPVTLLKQKTHEGDSNKNNYCFIMLVQTYLHRK